MKEVLLLNFTAGQVKKSKCYNRVIRYVTRQNISKNNLRLRQKYYLLNCVLAIFSRRKNWEDVWCCDA